LWARPMFMHAVIVAAGCAPHNVMACKSPVWAVFVITQGMHERCVRGCERHGEHWGCGLRGCASRSLSLCVLCDEMKGSRMTDDDQDHACGAPLTCVAVIDFIRQCSKLGCLHLSLFIQGMMSRRRSLGRQCHFESEPSSHANPYPPTLNRITILTA